MGGAGGGLGTEGMRRGPDAASYRPRTLAGTFGVAVSAALLLVHLLR